MNHQDHLHLLREGIPHPGGVWADFGSGSGAFTLALADLLGSGGEIFSVDRSAGALKEQERVMRARFPEYSIHYLAADFTRPLNLPALDGIVMANALHFIPTQRQAEMVRSARQYLHPGGRLLLVEYNTEIGNLWVPHPFTYRTWQSIAQQAGFEHTRLLATHPSSFLKEFYSTENW